MVSIVSICPTYTFPESYDIDSIESYYSDECWYETVVMYIKLSQIKFKKWDDSRYKQNFDLIKSNNNVLPIRLYDNDDGTYSVTDGNHRCSVCSDLGYTHIPAEVEIKRSYNPEPNLETYHDCIKIIEVKNKIMKNRTIWNRCFKTHRAMSLTLSYEPDDAITEYFTIMSCSDIKESVIFTFLTKDNETCVVITPK